jgi:hypothetical protein
MTRPGFILSLSNWRDEKALVRWRTQARHHDVQTKGREDVLADYHLRVGQVTTDTHLPAGCVLEEQRLDVTQVGQGTTVALINPLSGDTPAPWSDIATATAALGLQACATALRCQPPFAIAPGHVGAQHKQRIGQARARSVREGQDHLATLGSAGGHGIEGSHGVIERYAIGVQFKSA